MSYLLFHACFFCISVCTLSFVHIRLFIVYVLCSCVSELCFDPPSELLVLCFALLFCMCFMFVGCML